MAIVNKVPIGSIVKHLLLVFF